jgi:hypothetical protein
MRQRVFSLLAIGAALSAAACDGQHQTAFSANPAVQQSLASTSLRESPRASPPTDVAFVSDVEDRTINIYDFPAIGRPIRSISGLAYAPCSNSAGDVWVAGDYNGKVEMLEYRHDGTGPIDHLASATTGPYSCAVDPTSGNLAVASYTAASPSGSLTVYRNAKGPGRVYFDPNIAAFAYCAYDSKGNLLGQGYPSGSKSFDVFAELVKGANSCTTSILAAMLGHLAESSGTAHISSSDIAEDNNCYAIRSVASRQRSWGKPHSKLAASACRRLQSRATLP